MGKLVPMPKVSLAEPTLEVLRRCAHDLGMPLSEYVRLVLEGHVHGPEHVRSVALRRLERVLNRGAEMHPETGPGL